MAIETLEDLGVLNEEFVARENWGDRLLFEQRLASDFAMRRASGALEACGASL